MDIGIRSRLTTGLAAASVGALVMSPVLPGEAPNAFNWPRQSAVMLTSATQPMQDPLRLPQAATQAALPAATSLLNPLNPVIQQVSFNIAFLSDFVSTGAVLFGREFAIPGALLQSIRNGTSVPGALSQALQTFAQIELQAGRDLVGFAAQYVSFQLNFLASLASTVTMPLGVAKLSTVHSPSVVSNIAHIDTATLRTTEVKSSVSVTSTHTVTHKPSTPSTTGAASTRHQPRHDHDGHPKSGGGG